ncbi:SRPBCC family protein [Herbiconiux sp. VKM Ac-2851]|nr:SRPBCC family protein [Herbiconiux sp. VKM Ac-2851]
MRTARSTTQRSPESVFAALSDGWLVGTWLPGAKRIASVDATWPAPQSTVTHWSGVWPLLFRSETRVERLDASHRFVIRTRRKALGTTVLDIEVSRVGGRSSIAVTERGVAGLARAFPGLLRRRSQEAAQRLAWVNRR